MVAKRGDVIERLHGHGVKEGRGKGDGMAVVRDQVMGEGTHTRNPFVALGRSWSVDYMTRKAEGGK